MRAIIVSTVILISAGCERPTLVPDIGGSASPEQVLMLSSFNPADSVVVGPGGYRVGRYHDFTPFDSVCVNFTAEQLNPDATPAPLSVRVGPVNYYRDTLLTHQKEFWIKVVCADLVKPQGSALMFFATDPERELLLSHLRVIGWTAVSP